MTAAVTVPASLVAAAGGCTLSGPPPQRPGTRTADVDPDVALLRDVATTTDRLVALYEGVLSRHRELRRELRPLLRAHRRHASALGDAAPGAPSQNPRNTPSQPDVDTPRRAAAAVREIRTAERDASAELLGQTRRAESGTFARLLASMSACSAQHVQVLDGALAGTGRR